GARAGDGGTAGGKDHGPRREGRLLRGRALPAGDHRHGLRLGRDQPGRRRRARAPGDGPRSPGQGAPHLHLRRAPRDHKHHRAGAGGHGRAVPAHRPHSRRPAHPGRHRLHRAEPRHPALRRPDPRARRPHRAGARPRRRPLLCPSLRRGRV
ncbi:MAG: hypothetical protein AVDCRST_MAG05-4790, partial [uncultured Rubrobacteraceae bacterium]